MSLYVCWSQPTDGRPLYWRKWCWRKKMNACRPRVRFDLVRDGQRGSTIVTARCRRDDGAAGGSESDCWTIIWLGWMRNTARDGWLACCGPHSYRPSFVISNHNTEYFRNHIFVSFLLVMHPRSSYFPSVCYFCKLFQMNFTSVCQISSMSAVWLSAAARKPDPNW